MSNLQNQRKLVQIKPTNNSNGVFGYNNGHPLVSFDIPAVPHILRGGVRISGTMTIDTGMPAGSLPQNSQHTADRRVWLDSRTGVNSCFDFVSLSSVRNGDVYEQNKNYNRMCSSIIPLSESFEAYLGGGVDTYYGAMAKNEQQGRRADMPMDFCVKLQSALLNGVEGTDLMLVGGLRCSVNLASNSYVLRNNNWKDATDTSGTGTSVGATAPASYTLSNLVLSYVADVPTADQQMAMLKNSNGDWEYESYSSFYSVLSSAENSTTTNINTSRTTAVILNMLPSKFLNNVNRNSQLAVQPLKQDGTGVLNQRVVVKGITFLAGGVRTPLDFTTDTEQTQEQQTSDSQKCYEELNSLRDVWDLDNMLKTTRTELSLDRTDTALAKFQTSVQMNDAIQAWNVGVAYDKITEVGENFKNKPLSVRLTTDLVSGESHSVFMFVKHKNTISFNKGRVQMAN